MLLKLRLRDTLPLIMLRSWYVVIDVPEQESGRHTILEDDSKPFGAD